LFAARLCWLTKGVHPSLSRLRLTLRIDPPFARRSLGRRAAGRHDHVPLGQRQRREGGLLGMRTRPIDFGLLLVDRDGGGGGGDNLDLIIGVAVAVPVAAVFAVTIVSAAVCVIAIKRRMQI
jgi:hypothetical protein